MSTTSGDTTVLETQRVDSSGGARLFRDPDVVGTGSGAIVAWSHYRDTAGGEQELELARVTATGVGSTQTYLGGDGRLELNVELAYDALHDVVGVAYRSTPDPTTPGALYLGVFDTAGGFTTTEIVGETSGLMGYSVTAAADGAFGVAFSSTSGGPELYRLSSVPPLDPWAFFAPASALTRHVVGFHSGGVRYLLFGHAGDGLQAQTLSCI